MKQKWELRTLAEVSAINYGYTESASSEPVGPRFLRITDIQDDRVDWRRVPYCVIEPTDLAKYRIANGDIVFARTGATTGKSFLVREPPCAVFASYLIRLRLLDRKLLPEFVSLFFQTDGYWKSIKDGSAGSAQGGFNATKLGALSIPIPPVPEQQRIVGILDKAFEGIASAKANADKNLRNARAIFESHLQSVFTARGKEWVEKRLVEVCVLQRGLDLPTRARSAGDYPIVSSSGIIDSHIEGPVKGPGVVTGRSGSIGNVFYVDRDFWPLNTVLYVKDFHGNDPKFIYRLLSHFDLRRFATGAGVPTLNRNFVNDELVLIPASKQIQTAIVEQLDALEADTQQLAALYQSKLDALESMKHSLLDQAFTGQL